jgi:methionyl aminopeptidase
MIIYKTPKEIEIMAEGGKILGDILAQTAKKVKPGVGTAELNELAESLILKSGGLPAFKNYKTSPEARPFPTTLCTSINEEVVHAPAIPDRILKEGDIIGLDIGMEYRKMFTDMAVTVGVGNISQEAQKLLNVTQQSLALGLEQFKEGNNLADVARAIQTYVEKNGFSIVRELVGHGVGKKVHEDVRVPNYVTDEGKTIVIKRGMTVAIEPMVNIGDWRVDVADDGFTFITCDGTLSAHFEHTVGIDHSGRTIILTAFEN